MKINWQYYLTKTHFLCKKAAIKRLILIELSIMCYNVFMEKTYEAIVSDPTHIVLSSPLSFTTGSKLRVTLQPVDEEHESWGVSSSALMSDFYKDEQEHKVTYKWQNPNFRP